MVVLKSLLAGVAAFVGAVILMAAAFIAWGWWMERRLAGKSDAVAVALDVTRPWIAVPVLLVLAGAFAAGFGWAFRRTRR